MIKQATLDLLDADLRTSVERYKSYPFEDRHKLFTHDIKIDPYWSDLKFTVIPDLTWSRPFKYSEMPNFETIIGSEKIGIYLMYVRPSNLLLEMPRYVMYVGISGESGSERPLKERLMDYYYISKIKLRKNVHKMLQMYYDYVYIQYALYDGKYTELEVLETTLHEYFYPRFGKRDFEPETKDAQSAWNTGQ